jgi:uncharacterized protein (TIGR00290 family)
MDRVVVSWSGGKDASLALWETLQDPTTEVVELLTTVNEANDRVSMHGVREALLDRQAAALDLPLRKVPIPEACVNETYERRMAEAVADYEARGVDRMVFADLFLEEVREYRESRLANTDLDGAWPLWGRDTEAVAQAFLDAGFRARVACVNGDALAPEWAGRELDAAFFDELPDDVDHCGEYGEFHTFVTDGPVFDESVPVEVPDVVTRPVEGGEYHYADLRHVAPRPVADR